MDGLRNHLLPHPTLAAKQHGRPFAGGHLADQLDDALHCLRAPHDLHTGEPPPCLPPQRSDRTLQRSRLETLLERDQQILELGRLLQKMVGTDLHGLYGRGDVAVGREHHRDELLVDLHELAQQIHPAAVG